MLNLPHLKVKHIIAVASGKGGVGKSTVAINLACALQKLGHKIGLMDADIMGPSAPTMLGVAGHKAQVTDDDLIVPHNVHGISIVSMGLLIDDNAPATMRGAMISKYLKSFITSAKWGDLDYLIIDMPPGTGDIQISLCQFIPMSGVVIVTTPQDISFKIANKGLKMFELMAVPILGIVENMSGFVCPACEHDVRTLGHGAGHRLSEESGAPLLGTIPLVPSISYACDSGVPIAISDNDAHIARYYFDIANGLISSMNTIVTGSFQPFAWDWGSGVGAPVMERAGELQVVSLAKKNATTLSITYADGVTHDIATSRLRSLCTCAICKQHRDVQNVDVIPIKINSVGNYAIRIIWSDGHSSGIYSFKYLRQITMGHV